MQRTKIDVALAKTSMLDPGAVGVTARTKHAWHTLDRILTRTAYRPFVFDVRGEETEISTDPVAADFLCICVPTAACYNHLPGTLGGRSRDATM